jgi:hypothetical protein
VGRSLYPLTWWPISILDQWRDRQTQTVRFSRDRRYRRITQTRSATHIGGVRRPNYQSFELLLGQFGQITLALDCEPLNELFLMRYDPARSGDL